MDNKEALSDDQLNEVTGGVKTGDFNEEGKVYIKFPLIVSSMSGYYNTTELESLANQYAGFAALIAGAMTADIKNAVISLYKKENKEIPSNVKVLLGL